MHKQETGKKIACSSLQKQDRCQCCKYFHCTARVESPNISAKKRRSFFLQLRKKLASVNTQPEPSLRVSISTVSEQKRRNDDNDYKAPKLQRKQYSFCDRNKDRKLRLVSIVCKKYVSGEHSIFVSKVNLSAMLLKLLH